MDCHPEAGGAGVYMLRTDGTFALESRRGLPTPFVAFCKMSGLSSLFPRSRVFGRYYMRYLDEQQASEIEIISGACMLLRRAALDRVGLLDEDFFMYGEDIDLSYRILKGGYKNYFIPTRMLHYKGESTVKSSYRYVYTFYQAMRLFFRKHYSHYSFVVSIPITMAIWGRSFLAYIGNQLRHRTQAAVEAAPMSMLVVGSSPMLSEVRTLLERHQPKGKHRFVEATQVQSPDVHLPADVDLTAYDAVVYDTDRYTYAALLAHLEHIPGNTLRIATYSLESHTLITESAVYTL
jgi:hypothetical protein